MILSNGTFYNKVDGKKIVGESGEYKVTLVLASDDTGGGVASLLNPFGFDVIVTEAIVDITTAATAAGTLDVGIAAGATTSNDTLIDGLDVNAATGTFINSVDGGTNGGAARWEDDEYLTASKASGSMAGLAGVLYIKAIPVQS